MEWLFTEVAKVAPLNTATDEGHEITAVRREREAGRQLRKRQG